jgi:hypothetical protein
MTIVSSTRSVTGGVDTHLDVHVAAEVEHLHRVDTPSTYAWPMTATASLARPGVPERRPAGIGQRGVTAKATALADH